jgi:hypothetical protein
MITSLDSILIKNEYEKINNYLKERNIYKKSRLRIIEKYKLPEDLILYFLQGGILSWTTIHNYNTIYITIFFVIYATGLCSRIWMTRKSKAYSLYPLRSIYIQKKNLQEIINESLKAFYSNNTEIKGDAFIAITLLGYSIVDYPVYIDKNNENIEEIISKVAVDNALAHEMAHIIIGRSDIKASDLEYLIYLDMNNFLDANDPYKYEKTKEVIRKNVKRCVEYVKNEKRYNPYNIGICYANITLHENNFSIDIKKEIEKLRHMKNRDIINEIKNYALNYSN